jgi:hypothetical protein
VLKSVEYRLILSMFCGFCASSGIQGPHDHFLRMTKDPQSRICCPKLLVTECLGCGKFGHTAKYCGELKWNQKQAKQAQAIANKKAFVSGSWRQVGQGEGLHVTRSAAHPLIVIKAQVQNRYAAIDMLDEDENETDGVDKFNDTLAADCAGGDEKTWSQIVQQNGLNHVLHKPVANAGQRVETYDQDSDDDELPPVDKIVWGKFGATKWSDQ